MILEGYLIDNDYSINSENDYSIGFKKDLDYFLEKSQKEYPINIVSNDGDKINIVLLRNIKNLTYNFEYEEAIKTVLKFLSNLIPRFGLHEIDYDNDDYGFHPTFNIKIPKTVSSEKIDNIWDEIFEEVVKFVESNDIEFILDDLSIILSR